MNDSLGVMKSATIEMQTSASQPFVILPTFVNEKGPFNFVLDTGANVSIITEALAGSLEIHDCEVKEARGAGGKKLRVSVGRVNAIAVGGVRVADGRLGIMKTLPKCVGDGVIGYDFLKHFVVTIDYRNNRLTLAQPGEYRSSHKPPGTSVPLRLARADRPIILVDVLVNALNTYQFILDTGASQTVVSPALAHQMSLRSEHGDLLVGAGGVVAGAVGTFTSLRIGDAVLDDVAVMVSDVFSSFDEVVGSRLDGILGYNVLRKFRLIIDYPKGQVQWFA